MRAVLNLGTPFNLIISYLFSFILTSIKGSFLVYNQHHHHCEFDVSLFRKKVKNMNTVEISNLIKNVFKPDKQFPLP